MAGRRINNMTPKQCCQEGWKIFWGDKDYVKGMAHFREGIRISKRQRNVNKEAEANRGLAICLNSMGECEKALEHAMEAKRLYEKLEEPAAEVKIAKAEMTMSIIHGKTGNYSEQNELTERCLQVFSHNLDCKGGYAQCLFGKGINLLYYESYFDSLKYLKQAKNIFETESRKYERKIGHCNEYIAINYHFINNDEEAVELLDKAIEIYDSIEEEREMPYYYRGLCQESLGNDSEALSDFQQAIEIIEKHRGAIQIGDFRETFMAQKLDVYNKIIALCQKLGKVKEAYKYAQCSKGRAFAELLESRKKVGEAKDNALIRQERTLKKTIDKLHGTISRMDTGKNKKKMLEKLSEYESKYTDILSRIKQSNYEYSTLVSIEPEEVSDIKKLIDKDSVILDYYVTSEELYAFVITSSKLDCIVLDITNTELDGHMWNISDYLSRSRYMERTGIMQAWLKAQDWHLNRLYKKILKPVEQYLKNKKRLFIIPHKVLHQMPFNLLKNDNYESLGLKYELVYLSNPVMLRICREKADKYNKKESCLLVANSRKNLAYSEQEAHQISEVFNKSKKLLREEAIEETVKKLMPRYDIIHFSCHGKFNSRNPMFSHIVLNDRNNKVNRFEVNEIFNLKLKKTSLVTLSACESGIGHVKPGDEIVSLTRAFIYAGTPSVIVSLWEIDDKATSELMEEFYKQLRFGNSKSESLKIAQQKTSEKYQNPCLWGAFKLVGDWR